MADPARPAPSPPQAGWPVVHGRESTAAVLRHELAFHRIVVRTAIADVLAKKLPHTQSTLDDPLLSHSAPGHTRGRGPHQDHTDLIQQVARCEAEDAIWEALVDDWTRRSAASAASSASASASSTPPHAAHDAATYGSWDRFTQRLRSLETTWPVLASDPPPEPVLRSWFAWIQTVVRQTIELFQWIASDAGRAAAERPGADTMTDLIRALAFLRDHAEPLLASSGAARGGTGPHRTPGAGASAAAASAAAAAATAASSSAEAASGCRRRGTGHRPAAAAASASRDDGGGARARGSGRGAGAPFANPLASGVFDLRSLTDAAVSLREHLSGFVTTTSHVVQTTQQLLEKAETLVVAHGEAASRLFRDSELQRDELRRATDAALLLFSSVGYHARRHGQSIRLGLEDPFGGLDLDLGGPSSPPTATPHATRRGPPLAAAANTATAPAAAAPAAAAPAAAALAATAAAVTAAAAPTAPAAAAPPLTSTSDASAMLPPPLPSAQPDHEVLYEAEPASHAGVATMGSDAMQTPPSDAALDAPACAQPHAAMLDAEIESDADVHAWPPILPHLLDRAPVTQPAEDLVRSASPLTMAAETLTVSPPAASASEGSTGGTEMAQVVGLPADTEAARPAMAATPSAVTDAADVLALLRSDAPVAAAAAVSPPEAATASPRDAVAPSPAVLLITAPVPTQVAAATPASPPLAGIVVATVHEATASESASLPLPSPALLPGTASSVASASPGAAGALPTAVVASPRLLGAATPDVVPDPLSLPMPETPESPPSLPSDSSVDRAVADADADAENALTAPIDPASTSPEGSNDDEVDVAAASLLTTTTTTTAATPTPSMAADGLPRAHGPSGLGDVMASSMLSVSSTSTAAPSVLDPLAGSPAGTVDALGHELLSASDESEDDPWEDLGDLASKLVFPTL
ncbi:hypothetical protein CXG81DRAFT_17322 [Caulochytrium protostelioides]|uniref:Uncharacterized protein n=1 Tax=Caulochytrium protostelioides TaxID=1555241 RepID=A0A4P9XD12_9FUNG|nr:hypothetical protein CXG81DRAFT_17322 [Caulochytrium protostelioides]|eukprot:RKP03060.1 hypothetical protein CXG81DRAFT_17322 [Caulochytrium protostelioides]